MKDKVDKIISTKFEELSNLKLNFDEKIGLKVSLDNYNYEFIIRFVENEENFLVFSPDFLDDSDKTEYKTKPFFSRYEWLDDINYNIIYYNDPSRYDFENLNGVWGIGTQKIWHLDNISKIINILYGKLSDTLSVPEHSNLFIYGSSMGGFMSIALSTLIEHSTCICDNPQFNLYSHNYWKTLKENCFKGVSDEKINEYSYRLNIIDLMNKKRNIPNSYIIMDITDNNKWNKQYNNFLNQINKLPYDYNNNDNKINITFLSPTIKSESLPKDDALEYIENVINIEKRKKSFDSVKLQLVNEFDEKLNTFYEEYMQKKCSFDDFKNIKSKYFDSWSTCRVDIKNLGNQDNKVEVLESDVSSNIEFPNWFKNNKGEGLVLTSNSNSIELKLKCIQDGKLNVELRGLDFRNLDNTRKPVYICYKKLFINDEEIFSKKNLAWHDQAVSYSKECKNNEIVDVKIEFDTLKDYYPYLEYFIREMDNSDKLEDTFKNYEEYLQYIKLINKPF